MPKLDFAPSEYKTETTDQPKEKSYDLITPGWYNAEILEVSVKQYASGKGEGLQFTWNILGPSHAKRRVWDIQTTRHQSEMAEAIGRSKISQICQAIGKPQLEDTSEFLGERCDIKVIIEDGRNGYKPRNKANGYRPVTIAAISTEQAIAINQEEFDDDDIPF